MHSDPGIVRVAVIDIDSGFIRVLATRLDRAAWDYRVLASPVPPERLAAMRLNALLIDFSLLGPSGWEYLERVCRLMPGLAVLVTSQGSTVTQRVRALRLGAHDWISKPCHPEEVMARVETAVRRRRLGRPRADAESTTYGELEIRPDHFEAFVAGQSIGLTRREFELLQILADHRGKVLERDEVYRLVWGYEMVHGDRSVDVFVRKLRSKLERRSPGWDYIHTHFGVGYRFDPEPVAEESEPGAAAEPIADEGEQGREPGPTIRSVDAA